MKAFSLLGPQNNSHLNSPKYIPAQIFLTGWQVSLIFNWLALTCCQLLWYAYITVSSWSKFFLEYSSLFRALLRQAWYSFTMDIHHTFPLWSDSWMPHIIHDRLDKVDLWLGLQVTRSNHTFCGGTWEHCYTLRLWTARRISIRELLLLWTRYRRNQES